MSEQDTNQPPRKSIWALTWAVLLDAFGGFIETLIEALEDLDFDD